MAAWAWASVANTSVGQSTTAPVQYLQLEALYVQLEYCHGLPVEDVVQRFDLNRQ